MSENPQQAQEGFYRFPYHYIASLPPRFGVSRIDGWHLNYVSAVMFLLRQISLEQRLERIIDIGCGDGRFTQELAKKFPGSSVTGLDYSQKAIGLAQAMIHDPEILILDGPTSGLDPNQIVEIRNVIKEQGKNKLVLFSSHILQEVEAICDRVIIINKGKIVADDKLSGHQQRSYSNIIKVQFKEALESEWLKRVKGVKSVNKSDSHTWTIETDNPDMVRTELKKLERENNLDIISLQSENQSLEEVFRSLTSAPSGN